MLSKRLSDGVKVGSDRFMHAIPFHDQLLHDSMEHLWYRNIINSIVVEDVKISDIDASCFPKTSNRRWERRNACDDIIFKRSAEDPGSWKCRCRTAGFSSAANTVQKALYHLGSKTFPFSAQPLHSNLHDAFSPLRGINHLSLNHAAISQSLHAYMYVVPRFGVLANRSAT